MERIEDDTHEQSRLLQREYSPVSSASVGVPSTIIEPPNVYKSRWRSIRVMYLTMFLSSVSFSICMSSIWQYLQVNDKDASTDFLGWVVAAYSLGQLIASPVFGAWANIRKKSGEPLVVSLFINILANILYAYIESIPVGRKYILITARLLIGFGAGNVGVVRSYVSGATTIKERTSAMANTSIFQAMGFIIGPGIQAAMVPVGFPGPVHVKALHFDYYTAPGFLSAIVGVINVLLLFCVFSEHRVYDDNFSMKHVLSSGVTGNGDVNLKPNYLTVVIVIIIFFVVLFIFSVFETITTPLTMHMYGWSRSAATLYIGIFLGLLGILCCCVFGAVKFMSKKMSERYILLIGFCFCFCGYFIYLPWGNHYPDLTISDLKQAEHVTFQKTTNTTGVLTEHFDNATLTFYSANISLSGSTHKKKMNTTTSLYTRTTLGYNTSIVDLPANSSSSSKNHTIEERGCPVKYRWCFYTPVITLPQFLMGSVLFVMGYALCNVITYTLFSKILGPRPQFLMGSVLFVMGYALRNVITYTLFPKILGPRPQGIWMGWLTASGSLARTIGPVFVSQVYDAFGPRVTFVCMCVIILLTVIYVIIVFKRLVPFKFRRTVLTYVSCNEGNS